ncbi:17-beta-hydroxysteroid dehydrogenase 14-like [Liolophura sinensis]|uniref:17-beta-hydroxysteroid dehydrogenase 14-like n=1 Tax=Liolophura sinensis TaxID=3198878 RepID=UPI0031589246
MTGGRFKDKVVIVTGGSKGIGRGCVDVFVENGAKVVFCSRGVEEGKKAEAEVNAVGPGTSLFVPCDVNKEDQIKNVVEKTIEAFGQIDCLINNAGYHPEHQTIDEFSADDFRSLFNLNVVSYFLFAKFCLPHLRKTRGSIINNSSLVAEIGQKGAVTYVATKGAITSMTKALAIDEARHGVRVNSIAPGNVWTPLWESLGKSTEDFEKTKKSGDDAQLIGRMGTIRECGEACLFLAAEGQFCTGINLLLSGGAELKYGHKNQMQGTESVFG